MTVTPAQQLTRLVQDWIDQNLPEAPSGSVVQPCNDPRFGHYQSNVAMAAAKVLKKKPREIASSLLEHCQEADFIETSEIAGPGFVNFTFKQACLEAACATIAGDPHLGIRIEKHPRTIVVDFSAPNVAKEMHVGHIRSTILGDCIARILTARGHHVIRDNHIGDWGTQFGKLILGYKAQGKPEFPESESLAMMQQLYQTTHQACEGNAQKMDAARQELKKLQAGNKENLEIWKLFRDRSQSAFDSVYQRLSVKFDHTLGESFYNPWLKSTVDELTQRGIATESEGAKVVFFQEEELKEHPFLIEKSDGAALYATTDLATLKYRIDEWQADELIYVTDGRQQLHFQQLFSTAKRWGLDAECRHIWFGAILGENKKPLKTREGNPIRLKDLLDEAEQRALAILREKRADLADSKARQMARVIGIGSLKYADLSQNRNLDYVFDWDKLLAFDGNTAPYLLNAYVRTQSILKKADTITDLSNVRFQLHLPHEQMLSRQLLEYGSLVDQVTKEYRPHLLCGYLYEVASMFHKFFEHCPVLKAETDDLKESRLAMCQLSGKVLKHGLGLLGIETLEQM
ncbi:MAG: arginine--tRNA ligase [Verrucomicrobiota bacterium]